MQDIANEEILWLQKDGSEVKIHIRIGAPRQTDEFWVCPMRIEGLAGAYPEIGGASSLQALCLALGLAAQCIQFLIESGETLVHADDRTLPWDMVTLQEIFGMPGAYVESD